MSQNDKTLGFFCAGALSGIFLTALTYMGVSQIHAGYDAANVTGMAASLGGIYHRTGLNDDERTATDICFLDSVRKHAEGESFSQRLPFAEVEIIGLTQSRLKSMHDDIFRAAVVDCADQPDIDVIRTSLKSFGYLKPPSY